MPGNSSAKGSVTLDDKTANVGSIRSANDGVKLEAGGLLWLQGEDVSRVAGPLKLQGSEVIVTAASETRSSTDAQSSSGIHIGTNLFSIRPLTTGT